VSGTEATKKTKKGTEKKGGGGLQVEDQDGLAESRKESKKVG